MEMKPTVELLIQTAQLNIVLLAASLDRYRVHVTHNILLDLSMLHVIINRLNKTGF